MNLDAIFPYFFVLVVCLVAFQFILQYKKVPKDAAAYRGEVSPNHAIIEKLKLGPDEQVLLCIGEINYRRSGLGYIKYPGRVLENMIVTSKRLIIPYYMPMGQGYDICIFYNMSDIKTAAKLPGNILISPISTYINSYEAAGRNALLINHTYTGLLGRLEKFILYSSATDRIMGVIKKYMKEGSA